MPGFSVIKSAANGAVQNGQVKSGHERAYIRHIGKTQEELDDQAEYDLDSDDEEWLETRAKKVCEEPQNPIQYVLE